MTGSGAPTLDRLALGLLAGSIVSAPIVTVSMAVATNNLSDDVLNFALAAALVFLVLVVTMPLAQAPLWFVLRGWRLPDWAAATIAGGLAFLAPPILGAIAWADYAGPAAVAETVMLVVAWVPAGLVAGFVAWRVASFEVS